MKQAIFLIVGLFALVSVECLATNQSLEEDMSPRRSSPKTPGSSPLRKDKESPLAAALLKSLGLEANEVQRAQERLQSYSSVLSAEDKKKLSGILPRLLQPEELILQDSLHDLLTCPHPEWEHPALSPLYQLVQDLKDTQEEGLKRIFAPLISHYEGYMESLLLLKPEERSSWLEGKALITGEGLIEPLVFKGVKSWRLSQKTALEILSKDRYGLFIKQSGGSHSVCLKGGVYFKGNTTATGLPVGLESAAYELSHLLFGEGMAPTALLTLNKVTIMLPPQGSPARSDHSLSLAEGLSSKEFFTLYPHHQGAFTEKSPFHLVQASYGVSGMTLQKFIEGQYPWQDLDQESFGQQVIISLLINPSDYKPDNFIVQIYGGKPYPLVGIDNDMAFGPSIVKDRHNTHSLEVKNILYCLPLMDAPLAQGIRKRLLGLSAEQIVWQWLGSLRKRQEGYERIKEVSCMEGRVYQEELHLPVKLAPDFLKLLRHRLKAMQGILKENPAVTPNQLFSRLYPLVHHFYRVLLSSSDLLLEGYRKIHQSSYEGLTIEAVLQDHRNEHGVEDKSLGQLLEEEDTPVDVVSTWTRSLEEEAQDLLRETDIGIEARVSPFLKVAKQFPLLRWDQVHSSWSHPGLLLRAIREGASSSLIKFLLAQGGDLLFHDPQTQRTALHEAAAHSHSILLLMLDSLSAEERFSLLNAQDQDHQTPLDITMDRGNKRAFVLLIEKGSQCCSPSLALKFYKKHLDPSSSGKLKSAFKHLMAVNPAIEWEITLEEMLPPLIAKGEDTSLIFSAYGPRQLPPPIRKQILDGDTFIPAPTAGNHLVCQARTLDKLGIPHGLYFKVYPALPGVEAAAGRLIRLLSEGGAPYTDLARLGNIPILVSQEIPGDTLLKVLKTNPDKLQALDEEDLSGLILSALLINPEDGKPDNYIVSSHPEKEGLYRLVSIDNDQGFVPAVVKDKPSSKGKAKPVAQVKTILYCLDQMDHPVHSDVRNRIINLRPFEPLEQWLKELKRISQSYAALFNEGEMIRLFKEKESFLSVPFQPGAVRHLYEKLTMMQDLLFAHPQITYQELLSKLEPRLAKRYHQAFQGIRSVEERFKAADRFFYEMRRDGSYTTLTPSGHILQSMNIPLKESLLEIVLSVKGLGPLQALEELEQIRKEKGSLILEELGARAGDRDFLQSLSLEESRASFLKNLIIQGKRLAPQEQTAVLEYLCLQKHIRTLPLAYFSVLDNHFLEKFSLEHLKSLDVRGCSHLDNAALVLLSKKSLGLEELNLGSLPKLQVIGEVGLSSSTPLLFGALQTLNLSQCANLTTLLIKAPVLKWLSVRGCSRLTDEGLDSLIEESPSLNTLRLKETGLIQEQALRKEFPNFPASLLNKVKDRDRVKRTINQVLTVGEGELGCRAIDCSQRGIKLLTWALSKNATLTQLDLSDNQMGEKGVRVLSKNATLIQLNLGSNKIGDEGAIALSKNATLTQLDLSDNQIGVKGAKALSKNTSLTQLSLSRNKIGDEGAIALSKNTTLTQLDLSDNQIGVKGAKALSKNTSLTQLSLSRNKIGDEGTIALSKNTTLTQLNFGSNKIGDEGAIALSKILTLTQLDLSDNQIGAKGAKALSKNATLTQLNFGSNKIGDEGAIALSKILTLTQLDLSDNQIGAKGAKALSKNATLTQLNFGSNKIGDEGAIALSKNTTLTLLSLWNNRIGDEGAEVLSKNATLTQLSLWSNQIGARGARALSKNATLTLLDLSDNHIGDEGAEALSKNATLIQLNLSGNRIGDEGARALSKNATLTQLNLGGNQIGDEGAKELSKNATLTLLCLWSNQIGDEGARALSKNATLTQLSLWSNQIGDEGAKELSRNATLTQLDLSDNQIGDEGAKELSKNATLTLLNL